MTASAWALDDGLRGQLARKPMGACSSHAPRFEKMCEMRNDQKTWIGAFFGGLALGAPDSNMLVLVKIHTRRGFLTPLKYSLCLAHPYWTSTGVRPRQGSGQRGEWPGMQSSSRVCDAPLLPFPFGVARA